VNILKKKFNSKNKVSTPTSAPTPLANEPAPDPDLVDKDLHAVDPLPDARLKRFQDNIDRAKNLLLQLNSSDVAWKINIARGVAINALPDQLLGFVYRGGEQILRFSNTDVQPIVHTDSFVIEYVKILGTK